MPRIDTLRRNLLKGIGLLGGVMAFKAVHAEHTDTHFDEKSEHRVVYQCNKADVDYLEAILFSVGEMIRKYGDNVEVVVSAFGPGIHLLAKRPQRAIPKLLQERAASLSQYGVSFHACGNTLKALEWNDDELFDFAEVVPIGAEDLVLLQEQGFAYIRW